MLCRRVFRKRYRKLSSVLFSWAIVLYLTRQGYLHYATTQGNNLIDRLHEQNLKAVQLLTEIFDTQNWAIGELGQAPFKNCQEKRCYVFKPFKYSQAPLERSDAVLVHAPDLFNLPSRQVYKRNPKQIWLYYSMESQTRTACSSHYSYKDLDGWFNLTATFKQDSDIVTDYRPFPSWQSIFYRDDYINQYTKWLQASQIESKHEAKVMWLVSNCVTRSRREDYIKELAKYIKIDVYGKCGKQFGSSLNVMPDPCAQNKTLECNIDLFTRYKFYLAFENCLCNDYITEKFWRFYTPEYLFRVDIVPIVRGARAKQYQNLAYENDRMSFINADDFQSPRELASYLNKLISDRSLFMRHMKWKLNMINRFSQSPIKQNINLESKSLFCEVCARLYDPSFMESTKTVDISKWFLSDSECWDEPYPSTLMKYFFRLVGSCV